MVSHHSTGCASRPGPRSPRAPGADRGESHSVRHGLRVRCLGGWNAPQPGRRPRSRRGRSLAGAPNEPLGRLELTEPVFPFNATGPPPGGLLTGSGAYAGNTLWIQLAEPLIMWLGLSRSAVGSEGNTTNIPMNPRVAIVDPVGNSTYGGARLAPNPATLKIMDHLQCADTLYVNAPPIILNQGPLNPAAPPWFPPSRPRASQNDLGARRSRRFVGADAKQS
jgi:hypothetical protein